MDLSSVIGLIAGIVVVVVTIMISGSLAGYVDIPSIICTFGGAIAMTVMAFPANKLREGFAAVKYVFLYSETNAEDIGFTIALSSSLLPAAIITTLGWS